MSVIFAVAEILVTDPANYAGYLPLSTASVEKYGGKFLVRGGHRIQLEGKDERHNPEWRTVIVSFADREAALRWYESEDYQTARDIRIASSDGRLFFVDAL